jgi:hypothetical protein
MKTLAVFLTAVSLTATSDLHPQIQYDSAQWQHLKDSAWVELTSYSHYAWAFEWDSIFFVRWTSWNCEDIHDREVYRRAKVDAYWRRRNGKDDEPFPELNESKKSVAKKN